VRPGRGILSVTLATLAALGLVACAGLPTSGPVNEGLPAEEEGGAPDLSFIPDRPQPGATPEQIVDGFIRAGSGPAGGWARAQEFLAPGTEWNPNAGVIVDISGERDATQVDDDTVTMSVVTVANVDDRGSYLPSDGGETPLTFELAQMPDGEWRITDAPDGIVLGRDVFPTVFGSYSLMYFDPSWNYLVPDVRWFPTTNTATRITDALVNKPRPEWLAASVGTAFPEGVTASPAVPVAAGEAEVTLSTDVRGVDQVALDRMLTQLEVSLAGAGITSVEIVAGTTPLAAEPVEVRRTTVTGPPLVVVDGGFGFLVGNDLSTIPGLSAAMATVDPAAIQVAPDRDAAAVRLVDGRVVRVNADGSVLEADARPGLLDPSIDPFGAVWSVPRDDPQGLIAHLPSGRVVGIADAWVDAGTIEAMSVSRDGTRMAAILTVGGTSAVWVAGVLRGPDDAPVRLGDPEILGAVDGTGVGLAWLDDSTVGVLTDQDGVREVLEQPVGGPSERATAPADVISIAGGSSVSTVRLLDASGTVFVARGANWQQTASDVRVLATQQGIPE
jgi:hypothetical protein